MVLLKLFALNQSKYIILIKTSEDLKSPDVKQIGFLNLLTINQMLCYFLRI